MITGKSKTEATYRAVYLDSSSSLKDFSLDRKKYQKKYVLHEQIEDNETKAATMGRIVETLLMEPHEFDNKFYLSVCMSSPTGLMLEFVEALYKHTSEATDEQGNITRSFEEISKDAYADSGFKIKYEAVINKFTGSDAEIYYQEIRNVRSKGLTVVTADEVATAEKIVENLRTNRVTAEIVNLVPSARWSVKNQFQVEGYELNGHVFKSMIDKVIVDHENKTITIYDLKCIWAVEGFYEDYYLYRRAYIQAYLYYVAIQSLTSSAEHEWFGYNVLPPRFIVCDSTNYYNSLVYVLTEQDLKEALEGFEWKGRSYTGVFEIINDLKWALENDRWDISRKNYETNGLVTLKN